MIKLPLSTTIFYMDLEIGLEILGDDDFFITPDILNELIYNSTTQPKRFHKDLQEFIQMRVWEIVHEK